MLGLVTDFTRKRFVFLDLHGCKAKRCEETPTPSTHVSTLVESNVVEQVSNSKGAGVIVFL